RRLLLVVAGQVDIVHGDVDLDHAQAGHPLDRLLDVALNAAAQLGDAHAVLDHDVEVDRGLALADLDPDALAEARPGAAGDALAEGAERAAAAGAHGVHPGHLAARLAGDLLHDALGDGDMPLSGRQPIAGSGIAGSGTGRAAAGSEGLLARLGRFRLVHRT